MSPFSFIGASGVFLLIFISFFDENHVSKQNSPRWDATIVCTHLLCFFLLLVIGASFGAVFNFLCVDNMYKNIQDLYFEFLAHIGAYIEAYNT